VNDYMNIYLPKAFQM